MPPFLEGLRFILGHLPSFVISCNLRHLAPLVLLLFNKKRVKLLLEVALKIYILQITKVLKKSL